MAIIYFSN